MSNVLIVFKKKRSLNQVADIDDVSLKHDNKTTHKYEDMSQRWQQNHMSKKSGLFLLLWSYPKAPIGQHEDIADKEM